jgi:hypothetical protein
VTDLPQFSFKSYCWSVGTTSFRTGFFNVQIESQLALLDEFWSLPEYAGQNWSANTRLQENYYRFMQSKGFVKGKASLEAKDAREKTSGLVDIGLIEGNRKLTNAGKVLLEITKSGDFTGDNLLQLPADSFIYLKQLFKTTYDLSGDIVRPFAVTAYALLELEYLTDDEFTYLLPLCTTLENTKIIVQSIRDLRSGNGSIDEIIKSRLFSMDNYKAALDYFIKQPITEAVILTVGMNRKSGDTGKKKYDAPYYPFYNALKKVVLEQDAESVIDLLERSKKVKNKPGVLWRKYLFKTTSPKKIKREGLAALNNVPILQVKSEREFKKLFFELLHIFKARATLSDYFDLNRRYFRTSGTVIFADGKVEFDILPRCWLYGKSDKLLEIAFTKPEKLFEDIPLSEISPFLEINEKSLYANLQKLYGITARTADDAKRAVKDERYKRFNTLVDERFSRGAIINLLPKFEIRDDKFISQTVTNNADIPTIFEYILGIAWYLISDRTGDVLEYMNLSLEADLLPRTHAAGGNADIEYAYSKTATYPAHTLLIEATLADNSNQRRMEMEPVSRHLGEFILSSGDKNAYCVFISTFLHPSVVGDFRSWKDRPYYGRDYASTETGLKILPLATVELRTILEKRINYTTLYPLLEAAYRSEADVPRWYEGEMKVKVMSSRH